MLPSERTSNRLTVPFWHFGGPVLGPSYPDSRKLICDSRQQNGLVFGRRLSLTV